MADLTITMLGASGAGKTCFLVGLYNALRVPVKKFGLVAVDATPDVDTDKDLEDLWLRLHETGHDRWPAPTDTSREFTFAFQYAYKTILTFDWLDYRGGALTDQPAESDVRSLVARLQRSDAIFLCVPGDALVDGNPRAAKTDRMNIFLGRLRNALKPDDPLPTVVLVLTKWDVCVARGMTTAQIIEGMKELFNPLFAPGGKWLVTICPVTLGAGLSQNRDAADIAPRHIHLPVTFVTCMELKRRIGVRTAAIEGLDRERGTLGGNWLWEWWNSQELRRTTNAIALEQAQLARAKEDLAYLEKELAAQVNVYFDGTEHTYEL